jgi:hypothetical protein
MRLTLSEECLTDLQIRRRFLKDVADLTDDGFANEVFSGMFGRPGPALLAMARDRATRGNLSLDLVSAEILRHLGVNPAICATVATIGDLDILDFDDPDPTNYVAQIKGSRARIHLSPGSGVMWDEGERAFRMPGMPEAISALIDTQTRLSRFIGHPTLDALPLTVRRKFRSDEHITFHISGSRWLNGHAVAAYLPGDVEP